MDNPSEAPETETRPPDEWILEQQNAIREESAAKPYIGALEELQALSEEYQEGTVFRQKIAKLRASDLGHFRRVRGDGNCLYRGFLYSYLEFLLSNRDEANNFLGRLSGMKEKLVNAGYHELVFEDSLELLVDTVKDMHENSSKRIDREMLLFNLNEDMVSNLLVMLMRMITGAEIKERDAFFFPFILGSYEDCGSTDGFLSRYVEPMGEEADHIQIVALTDALNVAVKVVYLDRSGGGDDTAADVYSFVPESLPSGTKPNVVLLYRPGHYDILYA